VSRLPIKTKAVYKAPNGDTTSDFTEEGIPVWARDARGRPICNSPKRHKETRSRCRQWQGLGVNGRCGIHGGKTPNGVDMPNFKHGRTSKYRDVLKPEHVEMFDQLIEDPDYAGLREDIAVTRLRLREAMALYSEIDEQALQKLIQAAGYASEVLEGEYDSDDVEQLLIEIVGYAKQVKAHLTLSSVIDRSQETVRKLVETETKRITSEQEQIPAARALMLFVALRESVRVHVFSFMQWLATEHPEVTRSPGFFNPLERIMKDVQGLLPKRIDESTVTTIERKQP
jgi:hypothetical protein